MKNGGKTKMKIIAKFERMALALEAIVQELKAMNEFKKGGQ